MEEAVRAGITDILIITNRGKNIIEDHFDHSVELEERLESIDKSNVFRALVAFKDAHLVHVLDGIRCGTNSVTAIMTAPTMTFTCIFTA